MRPAHRFTGLLAALVLLAGCGGTDEPEEDPSGAAEPEAEGDVISFDEAEVGKDAEATLRGWLEAVDEGDFKRACELSAARTSFHERGETEPSHTFAPLIETPDFLEECQSATTDSTGRSNLWPQEPARLRATEVLSTDQVAPSSFEGVEFPQGVGLRLTDSDLDYFTLYDFDGVFFVGIGSLGQPMKDE